MRYFIIFLLFSCVAWGQSITDISIIGNYEKKSGIDTLIVYRDYYRGGHKTHTISRDKTEQAQIIEKECEESDAVYLFYTSKGKTYIEKRNECYKYRPVHIDGSKAFTFFLNNFNDLKQDSIYPFGVKEKGKEYYNIYQDHTYCTDLYLSIGNQTKVISWEGLDFADSTLAFANDSHKTKNVNYERNLNSKTNKLNELIYKDINGIIFSKN